MYITFLNFIFSGGLYPALAVIVSILLAIYIIILFHKLLKFLLNYVEEGVANILASVCFGIFSALVCVFFVYKTSEYYEQFVKCETEYSENILIDNIKKKTEIFKCQIRKSIHKEFSDEFIFVKDSLEIYD